MKTISYTTPKARKEHTCNWCGEKIKIGENYTRAFCKEDDVYLFRNHIYCEKIAQELRMFGDGPLGQDFFLENISEEYITIMENYHSEIFNYEHFQYPNFKEQLEFVCKHYKIL